MTVGFGSGGKVQQLTDLIFAYQFRQLQRLGDVVVILKFSFSLKIDLG